jgi:hypothetical protein
MGVDNGVGGVKSSGAGESALFSPYIANAEIPSRTSARTARQYPKAREYGNVGVESHVASNAPTRISRAVS